MIPIDQLSDPTVRTVVSAINAGDRDAFMSAFTPDATMADDGSDRNLQQWSDREIFSASGHMDVEAESGDGRSLVVRYRNDMWGEMLTSWSFTITDGKVSRMETGQT